MSGLEKYSALVQKREDLLKTLAVMQAEEKRKAERRDELSKELSEAGIDVSNLEGELTRIESERESLFTKVEEELAQFELKLKEPEPVKVSEEVPKTSNEVEPEKEEKPSEEISSTPLTNDIDIG